jgi:hypothetical protein
MGHNRAAPILTSYPREIAASAALSVTDVGRLHAIVSLVRAVGCRSDEA